MKLKTIIILTTLLLTSMSTFSQKDYSNIPCFKLHFTMIKDDNIQKVITFKHILLRSDTLTIERTIHEMIQSVEGCKKNGLNPFYEFMKNDFKDNDINFEKGRLFMIETLRNEMKPHRYYANKKYYELNPDELLILYFHYQNGLDDQNDWFLKPEYSFSWGFCEAFKQYFDIEFFHSKDD